MMGNENNGSSLLNNLSYESRSKSNLKPFSNADENIVSDVIKLGIAF